MQQVRHRRFPKFVVRPTTRKPWHVRKWTQKKDDHLITSNEQFIKDVITQTYVNSESPLKDGPWNRNAYVKGYVDNYVLILHMLTLKTWLKEQ